MDYGAIDEMHYQALFIFLDFLLPRRKAFL